MKTLDELMQKNGSDKASVFTRTYAKPHDYCRHLSLFLDPIRERPVKMLEIGCGGGESVKGWLEFFEHPESKIVSVDIVKETNDYNSPDIHPDKRYSFCHGDQGSDTFWACFLADFGSDWDFICDDGSHYAKDIITTFNCLWPHLRAGGIYAIEDLNTAYGGPPFTIPGQPTQLDFIKDMLDQINRGQNDIDRLHYSQELCILQKKA